MQNKEDFLTNRTNISELAPKEDITSTYLVKSVLLNEAKDGKKYLNAVLCDGTGDLECRMWHGAVEVEQTITKGDVVLVSGKVNLFQGRKQFIISQIEKVDASKVDMSAFILKAKMDPEKMYQDLLLIVEKLEDVYIKELLNIILGDDEISRRLKLWQAGKSVHHAYQSGLLEHILSCATLANYLSEHYEVNKSYVVAGAILHDLCKIYELSDGFSVEYTEEGKLIGHLIKGVEIIDRFAFKIPNFPYQMKLHLKHIILSHHGELAYGSPKVPLTIESYLVHLIDLMDSKMNSMAMMKRMDSSSGNWSNYNKYLDRIVYKSELPTFDQFLDDKNEKSNRTSNNYSKNKNNKSNSNPKLKQSLGKFLEDYKVNE